jgi:hypothetical protein
MRGILPGWTSRENSHGPCAAHSMKRRSLDKAHLAPLPSIVAPLDLVPVDVVYTRTPNDFPGTSFKNAQQILPTRFPCLRSELHPCPGLSNRVIRLAPRQPVRQLVNRVPHRIEIGVSIRSLESADDVGLGRTHLAVGGVAHIVRMQC